MRIVPIALATLLALPLAFAEKKSDQEYWRETNLSTEMLLEGMKMLTRENCLSKLAALEGCVAMINSVGARAQVPVQLVPISLAGNKEFVASMPLRYFPDFVLVSRPPQDRPKSPFEAVTREKARNAQLRAGLEAIFKASMKTDLEKVFRNLLEFAVKDPADNAMVAAGAFDAYIIKAEDAHAHLEPTAQQKDKLEDASENFVGIGANLEVLKGRPVIQSPIEGGPAEKAGLLANDVILNVDGESTEGLDVSEVVGKIRGPEGTSVRLTLLRKNRELDLTIARGKVVVENVTTKMISDMGQNVGYIRLRSFSDDNACEKIAKSIKQLEKQGAKGLVLDLRSNGGGLVNQSVCMGGLFVGQQVIVKVKNLQSDTILDVTSEHEKITDLPLAILINAGSASASEILAGALQDYKRAWIVGERSFGKATVQSPVQFFGNERIMFYRTIQRFYQPTGRTNQVVGILPDVTAPFKPDATEEERFSPREADYFTNALSAVGETWTQPRVEEVRKLESCMAQGNSARGKHQAAVAAGEVVDYQILAAEEVLSCR